MGIAQRIGQAVENVIQTYQETEPKALTEKMGIVLKREPLPEGVQGLTATLLGYPYIVVQAALPKQKERYVLAHELGHHVLHPCANYYFLRQTYAWTDKLEFESDLFATFLLARHSFASWTFQSLHQEAGLPKYLALRVLECPEACTVYEKLRQAV
ncbi:ImmA/IrrE family metallo-endopeptidase [Alicyclobacillus tolerans]|uniref:IrrE N-terminal-like domain-containing protein n=2 Tax=Alicyclobacillus tolerans TaxID=90970 RepID=A0A1M6X2B6_9BACL|nr:MULTISPECIES: ImmA/IrrE family metallo-endopeptidase [Alicyclobacillus]MDP9728946.1 Zn-dependent peptidase ImmA (M78 family) [Alicyclobacillus tengchongensis]QRF23630.1 ImmA/IrrE family metallo-endopeptidase [Alicyclobacillus sp. TC]SHL00073.1 protein of unknown function [Alicyclobacillus montanus]